jgi:hypothetical protein
MNKYINLTPAYGRDYKYKAEIIADLLQEKDFIMNTPHGSTYINFPQIEVGTVMQVRYSKLRKVCSLTKTGTGVK